MKVWLITVGEPLPIDDSNPRLLRTGILSDIMARRGDEVLWWTSAFDHVQKRHRFPTDAERKVGARYRIRLLRGRGYRKNVSVARFLDHRDVAAGFRKNARSEPAPDVILCSLPTLELCVEAVRYGRERRVPVVLDVRDLWPDLFVELVPSWCRRAARLALTPLFGMAREACSGAAAIVGVTQEFVGWGLRHAGRAGGAWDREFPMAYSLIDLPPERCAAALSRWRALGIGEDAFVCCFFGSMGRQFDLDTVISAAQLLEGSGRPFRFVLCGSGENLERYRRKAAGRAGVLFPGWVDRADIWALMGLSSAGLSPYLNKPNFTMNIPNKPIEYLSAGLPIVSSLTGVLQGLLARNRCGVTYEEGNPESLAEAVIRLYDDREELRLMAANAKVLYEKSYQAEKVYGEMAGHLERIAEERKR